MDRKHGTCVQEVLGIWSPTLHGSWCGRIRGKRRQLGAAGSETRFNAMWQACRFPNSCTAQPLLLFSFFLHAYLLILIDRMLSLHTVVLAIMNCPTVPVLAEICNDELVLIDFFIADFGHRLRGVRGEGTEVGLLTRRQRTGCWDARHYHSILAPLLFSPGMAGMMADSDSSQLRGSSEPISSILP